MKNTSEIASRTWIVFALMAFIALAIFVRIIWIQTVDANKWSEFVKAKQEEIKDIEPTRGQIFSTDGSLLATSVPVYNLYWDSQANIDDEEFNRELDTLCINLSNYFGDRTPSEYQRDLLEAKRLEKKYYLVKRKINHLDKEHLKTLPFIRRGKYKSGFIFERRDIRKKPFGKLASRTIGIDRLGARVGIELAFNEDLAGKPGKQLMERIAGSVWKPTTDEYIVNPVDGVDLVSTIDVHLQDVATTALEKQLKKHYADWGTVILMEVETGYVRAISNLERDEESGEYYETYNFAIGEATEPGSTFKLASMISMFDEGLISLEDSVNIGNGTVEFYGEEMSDSHEYDSDNTKLTVREVFAQSSNVGTALLVQKHFESDPQRYLDKLGEMGLRSPLEIKLKGEPSPMIYEKVREGNWSGLSLTQMSIGYEVLQTPLQTLAFYNAIANDGKMVRPLFVEALKKNGKTLESFKPVVIKDKICSNSTLRACQDIMEASCKEEYKGTASEIFKNSPYHVAGKTGTAKIAHSRGYYRDRYRASFVGYFPAENPRYACLVLVNDTKTGSYYGSTISAPVFRDVANKIYATQLEMQELIDLPELVGEHKIPVSKNGAKEDLEKVFAELKINTQINTQEDWVKTSTKETLVEINTHDLRKGLVPDVRGMGLQDAIYLLENCGLNVKISGHGTVKRQSVTPGARLSDHRTILIELS
ncbi:MAG: penicillin-binding transpeptidase domain-containing protein [Flavobacteriales bacterium]|nr:penicillin-binding transpeptidase domain-containing protein [Flavobacteriales bacterium]